MTPVIAQNSSYVRVEIIIIPNNMMEPITVPELSNNYPIQAILPIHQFIVDISVNFKWVNGNGNTLHHLIPNQLMHHELIDCQLEMLQQMLYVFLSQRRC